VLCRVECGQAERESGERDSTLTLTLLYSREL